jgi:hypothetical protein
MRAVLEEDRGDSNPLVPAEAGTQRFARSVGFPLARE